MKTLCFYLAFIFITSGCTSTNYIKLEEWEVFGPLSVVEHGPPEELIKDVEEVLANNQGNLLYPEDVGNIDFSSFKKGMTYKYASLDFRMDYTFEHYSDGYFYFVMTRSDYDGPISARTDGVNWEWKGNKVGDRYYVMAGQECKFKLGACRYKIVGDRYHSSELYFRDGVWVRKFDVSKVLSSTYEVSVYDKFGMILYTGTYNSRSGGNVSYLKLVSTE
ncbi:Uncharacterised protein [Vibrio mimicus]|uniref:hypothetical protein n=1 Tax=Vibrio mimicus TaxID=674 RepID=UPI0002B9F3CF|nr:hypothetical protein [Vibrio mimicus]EMB48519.1 hypothetical protein D908_18680 [Vibrio mimicus CAIM 602]MBY7676697.1 hypothetical protein [Vibrio mimicus]MBY7728543.1 hypothetical protein [Vibrio mimicus]TXY28637.1 hypothetical protein FXE86_16630 [Vibrio mimicus]SUQ23391.1 Uncharacterised protein [Vibrio mimicus]